MLIVMMATLSACSDSVSVEDYAKAINKTLETTQLDEGMSVVAVANGNSLDYITTVSNIPENADFSKYAQAVETALVASVTDEFKKTQKDQCPSLESIHYIYKTDKGELIVQIDIEINE